MNRPAQARVSHSVTHENSTLACVGRGLCVDDETAFKRAQRQLAQLQTSARPACARRATLRGTDRDSIKHRFISGNIGLVRCRKISQYEI